MMSFISVAQSHKRFAEKVPSKVEKIMADNGDFDHPYHNYVAWGIAKTSGGEKLYWYSFLNSDAYYQFRFSGNISRDDSAKICKLMDGLKRPYEVSGAWVGASNDWCMSEYSPKTAYKKFTGKTWVGYDGKRQPEYTEIISLSAATTEYARKMRSVFTVFEVGGISPDITSSEYAWALK